MNAAYLTSVRLKWPDWKMKRAKSSVGNTGPRSGEPLREKGEKNLQNSRRQLLSKLLLPMYLLSAAENASVNHLAPSRHANDEHRSALIPTLEPEIAGRLGHDVREPYRARQGPHEQLGIKECLPL